MVNPLLTLLFDVLLITSALGVLAWMVREYLETRRPAVGAKYPGWGEATQLPSGDEVSWRPRELRRSA